MRVITHDRIRIRAPDGRSQVTTDARILELLSFPEAVKHMTRRTRNTDDSKTLASRLRRGASPHNSREAGARFEKGHAKRGGRKKGVPNKLSRDLKEAIIEAAIASGYDTKGKDGLTGYLKRMADYEVQIFGGMLRAMIPLQVNATLHQPKTFKSPDEIKAALKERGIPQVTIYRLEHHDPPEPANHSELDPEAEERQHAKKAG
jgi:hypothetical protein